MIGQLKGQLLLKQPPVLILEVNGVGYEIDAPMSTFYQLPSIGETVTLLTHLVVREDAHCLYGFYTPSEKALFRTLLKVNGVGPRLALAILSSVSPDEFVHTILNQDTASLTHLPGIGKKTAERLIIEMKDKLSDWQPQTMTLAMPQKEGRHGILQDAISALVALGYKSQEANRVITKIDDGSMKSEELIRHALREMVA